LVSLVPPLLRLKFITYLINNIIKKLFLNTSFKKYVKFASRSFVLALILGASYSCDTTPADVPVSDTALEQPTGVDVSFVQTDYGITITETNQYYQTYLKSEAFKYTKEFLGDFKVLNIQLADFPNLKSKGLAIKINPKNGLTREIMVVIAPSTTGIKVVGMLREQNIKGIVVKGKAVPDGTVSWYSLAGGRLNSIHFNAGKIDKFSIFKVNSSSRTNVAPPPCCWACTEEQFNANYQAAKSSCEGDWQCDVSCSFNPCALSYLASAVIACTECGSGNPQ